MICCVEQRRWDGLQMMPHIIPKVTTYRTLQAARNEKNSIREMQRRRGQMHCSLYICSSSSSVLRVLSSGILILRVWLWWMVVNEGIQTSYYQPLTHSLSYTAVRTKMTRWVHSQESSPINLNIVLQSKSSTISLIAYRGKYYTFNFLFWWTFNQNLGSLLFPFVFFLMIKRKKRKSNQESHKEAIVIIRMLVAYKYQGKEEASATVTLKGRAISAVHPLAPYLHWFFWCSSAPYLAINVNGHHRPHIEQMIICCEIESKRHLFRGREMASPLIR